jgi:thiosulfate/3-mercaptopyruvate sulfurtransferase
MARSTLLVGPEELRGELHGDRPPVVLDVRWQLGGPPAAELYTAGHLPAALFVDLDRDLAGPPGRGGRHPLPDPEQLQERLRGWGIRSDSAVVAYDAADGTSAARAWWTLRWAGLSDVRLLDGGLAAWTAAGYPVSTDEPRPAPGDVVVRPGAMPTLDAHAAAEVARHGVLLDARSPERYRGEIEPVDPVAGHIPGAISAPSASNVIADGRFAAAADLRRRFAGLGVTIPDGPLDGDVAPVGAYCGSGVVAAHQVFALALTGVDAGLYVGSWSEWLADPARPVAIGAQPDGQRRGRPGRSTDEPTV